MNLDEALKALAALNALSQTLTPLIRDMMANLSTSDQDKLRQAAQALAEQNDALHKQVTDRLRG